MEAEGVEFCSLYYLLVERQVSEAAIAEAISREGIYGFDRHGRLQLFGPDTEQAHHALDALAAQYDSNDTRYPGDRQLAVDSVKWELTFERHGWPQQELPSFASTSPSSLSERSYNRPLTTKQRNNQLYLIGALLEFIRGQYTGSGHPDYKSDQQLMELLRKKTEAPGMSERNLQTVFKEAKDALEGLNEQ